MKVKAAPEAAGQTSTAPSESGHEEPMNVDTPDAIAGVLAAVQGEDVAPAPEIAPEPEKSTKDDQPTPDEPEVPEQAPETDDQPDDDKPEPETTPEEEQAKAIKQLPKEVQEQVQAIIDRRIGQVVKQRKAVESELELAESRARRAEEAQEQLRADLEDKSNTPANVQNVNPLLLSDEAKVDEYDRYLADLEALAVKHWDGKEDESGRSYSAEEIRSQYSEIRKMRSVLVPQARELARVRTANEQMAKQVHPELFDRKTEENRAMRHYLNRYPHLLSVPNIHMILGDAIKYERIRTQKKDESKAKAEPVKKKAPPAPPPSNNPPPPRPAGNAAPSLVDLSRVAATGGSDPDAIAEAVAGLTE
jgi:outer membrane biosynthesis protein TonB